MNAYPDADELFRRAIAQANDDGYEPEPVPPPVRVFAPETIAKWQLAFFLGLLAGAALFKLTTGNP
jgi:hypothetical protein